MYKAIKDNKIIAISDIDNEFKFMVKDSVETDAEHTTADYTMVGSEYALNDDEKAIEIKKEQVRAVREQYFTDYVDWHQSKPLLWEELTEEEKTDIANYRQYLKDYTSQPEWYLANPMDFDTWKKSLDENTEKE